MLVALRWFDRSANDVAVDGCGLTGRTRFAGPAKAVLPAALAVPLLFAGWGMLAGGRSAPLPETMQVDAPPGRAGARVGSRQSVGVGKNVSVVVDLDGHRN